MSSRRVRTTEKWGGKAGGTFPKEYARISYTFPLLFQVLSTLNRSWEFNCNINKDTWFGFSLNLFCLCSTLETLTLQREQKMRQTQTNTKSQSFFFFLKHEQILTYAPLLRFMGNVLTGGVKSYAKSLNLNVSQLLKPI